MQLYLAPMQGVVDFNMRKLLTEIGGYHRCVTEFVRVAQSPLPDRTFYRYCPELLTGGRTVAGVPVHVQLLGSHPQKLAAHAKQVAGLGAIGIDLNFGCPAKTVNRHGGGSALLTQPDLVSDIVKAVRDSVEDSVLVTAKIRLGFDNADRLAELCHGIISAGADELCIHARTRQDGYKPPAHWHVIGDISPALSGSIIVNGEIWSAGDASNAIKQSGASAIMLGRGALSCPDLALQIQSAQLKVPYQALQWPTVLAMVEAYFLQSDSALTPHVGNRTKQWLVYLMRQYPQARTLFQQLKRLHAREPIMQLLCATRRNAETDLRWAS